MRVNGQSDIRRVAAGLDGERNLADQLAGIRTNDAATQYAVRLGVEQQLREAFIPADGEGPPARHPGEGPLPVGNILRLGLGLRETDPGNLGIRVSNRRYAACVEGPGLARGHFRGDL